MFSTLYSRKPLRIQRDITFPSILTSVFQNNQRTADVARFPAIRDRNKSFFTGISAFRSNRSSTNSFFFLSNVKRTKEILESRVNVRSPSTRYARANPRLEGLARVRPISTRNKISHYTTCIKSWQKKRTYMYTITTRKTTYP